VTLTFSRRGQLIRIPGLAASEQPQELRAPGVATRGRWRPAGMIGRVDHSRPASNRLSSGLRDWRRGDSPHYLSDFEGRLNRSLWLLLVVALTYAIFQHVLLADVPEAFQGGARLGALCYDLAIAYTGAFTFYVLNIRLPLRRDRRNVYRHLPALIDQLIHDIRFFSSCLSTTAFGHLAQPDNTLDSIREMCRRLTLDSTVAAVLPTSDPDFNSRAGDVIDRHIVDTRAMCHEILSFSTFLDSEVIDQIFGISYCAFFKKYERDLIRQVRRITSPGEPDPWDLSRWADEMHTYFDTVERLDLYRKKSAFLMPDRVIVDSR
jgi:hypothetical protein